MGRQKSRFTDLEIKDSKHHKKEWIAGTLQRNRKKVILSKKNKPKTKTCLDFWSASEKEIEGKGKIMLYELELRKMDRFSCEEL